MPPPVPNFLVSISVMVFLTSSFKILTSLDPLEQLFKRINNSKALDFKMFIVFNISGRGKGLLLPTLRSGPACRQAAIGTVTVQPEPLLSKVNVVDVVFCCWSLFVQPGLRPISERDDQYIFFSSDGV